MEVGETLYVHRRADWRRWLARNHDKAREIWLVHYRKGSGKPSLPYDDAVEEALCYGWIDSIVKKVSDEAYAQRYTPRKAKSKLSETNRVRVLRLIDAGKMTRAGLGKVQDKIGGSSAVAPDLLRAIKSNKIVWKNFQAFPESYRQIRVGWIETARSRPEARD